MSVKPLPPHPPDLGSPPPPSPWPGTPHLFISRCGRRAHSDKTLGGGGRHAACAEKTTQRKSRSCRPRGCVGIASQKLHRGSLKEAFSTADSDTTTGALQHRQLDGSASGPPPVRLRSSGGEASWAPDV
ncbi:hypothetical protein EYF80_033310 [Liparis tanakae]|uniref:Uncharacterized protein n=1 Tax=Liparis tanakae TaxID=230148 RepID=A0A4Z2GT68_9TELE|nr:hypothetical protein EYF80_033310 [Liparis tanakae]